MVRYSDFGISYNRNKHTKLIQRSSYPCRVRNSIRRHQPQEQQLCTVRHPATRSPPSTPSLTHPSTTSMTRNIRIVPDHIALSSLPDLSSYDILILPGGAPGAKTFSTST